MAAVSAELLETIIELQSLSSLKNAVLGGGTNLATRYDHRESIDIDLFFSGIIGKTGYKEIENEIHAHFGGNASRLDYPFDESDKYMFMRFWVKKYKLNNKVEIIQNASFLDETKVVLGARLASIRDLGLLKLMTASNRASFKDIYDLDYLTDDVSLTRLMAYLKQKQETFKGEEHRTIFDLDDEISPVEDNITVTNIVVHKVNKIGGQKYTSIKLAEKELIISKQEIYFVAELRTSFQKNQSPHMAFLKTTIPLMASINN
jgi:hypothetical protein